MSYIFLKRDRHFIESLISHFASNTFIVTHVDYSHIVVPLSLNSSVRREELATSFIFCGELLQDYLLEWNMDRCEPYFYLNRQV